MPAGKDLANLVRTNDRGDCPGALPFHRCERGFHVMRGQHFRQGVRPFKSEAGSWWVLPNDSR
jgi:hypothetical protein